MAQENTFNDATVTPAEIAIRKIGVKDLWQALGQGFDDFKAKPSHIVFLCVIYPLASLLVTMFAIGQDLLPLAFPLISGLTLIGPVVAVGLCEMSRRREQGLDVSWSHAFDFVHSASFAAVAALSVAMMMLYLAWLYLAQTIYGGLFGTVPPESMSDFLTQVLTTRRGGALIVYGTAVGFVFAVVALAISVVSFPLILDRQVSAATAVRTSIKAVTGNPVPMAFWGLIVVILLIAGSIPFLIGLVLVLPVLGHATWHLYRKVVEP